VSVYEKLDSLNIALPELTPAVAAFVPFLRNGNSLFSSGHIAKMNGKPWVRQLGANLTTAQGKDAARAVAIDLMGTLHAAVGDLNQIKRIVSAREQHSRIHRIAPVANGASELFGEVFGDIGEHVRSAFGVAQVPFGSCVEIELVVELP
jgi:enamine deaminase RidA (YjgF/YER057c/UK114 family)